LIVSVFAFESGFDGALAGSQKMFEPTQQILLWWITLRSASDFDVKMG
jgi:hypothetical protein